MNIDFRVSTGFFEHPKTVRLHDELGDAGILSLLRLWRWCALYRPGGGLGGLSEEQIAQAGRWIGDAHRFVEVLCRVGYLEASRRGHLRVHDWLHHNAYAASAPARSRKARRAALSRWLKRECSDASSKARAGRKQCSDDAKSNAPSPAPSPDPAPLSDLTPAPPSPAKSKPKKPKILSREKGLIGDLARIHLRVLNVEMSPTREQIIALLRKRARNPHHRPHVIPWVYENIWLKDDYWRPKGCPFGKFVEHLDTLIQRAELTAQDFVGGPPCGCCEDEDAPPSR